MSYDELTPYGLAKDAAQDQVLTHGYVHGHIHQHKDHMHIHGHIHNHDHEQYAPVADPALCELDPNLDLCDDIFCDELDDCYFDDCGSHRLPDVFRDDKCCDEAKCCDPTCLDQQDSICTDPACLANHHHGNSLCERQKPKVSIFENLLQNVQRNIEQFAAPQPAKRAKLDPSFRIHFPHQCHLDPQFQQQPLSGKETPVLPSSHNTHQSCFHAKLPSADSVAALDAEKQFDFNFFVQFNNFNQMLSDSTSFDNTYACQWDNCVKKVSDSSLVNHLVDDHLKDEYRLQSHDEPHPAFECEWDSCHFVDDDFQAFLAHLNSHKTSSIDKLPAEHASPLLTPSSITTVATSPLQGPKRDDSYLLPTVEKHNPVNITEMRIQPQAAREKPDAAFTCKWHIGTTDAGEPVLCNRTHENEGHLQEHLQEDHIGQGKSIYHCCWYGCDRNQGKPFVQRQKLFRHIHVHTNYKPCRCEVCGLLFAVPAMLAQHLRTHSGEKPFTCKICGKKFTTSSSLSIHNRVHSGDKPLLCTWPGCGKRFRESSNLAKHMRVHTTKYKCEICGDIFDQKKQYTRHRKVHDREPARAALVAPNEISL